jgi:hypothetical protein
VQANRLLVALTAACALALVCVGSAVSRSAAFEGASLSVDVETELGQSYFVADIDFGGRTSGPPDVPGRVDLTVPAGYGIDLTGSAGAEIGAVLGAVTSGGGNGLEFVNGSIVVVDPAAYAADPVAQACAPGTHTAVWNMTAQLLGNPVNVPIAVDQSDSGYVIHYCPFLAPSSAYAAGLVFIDFQLALPLAAIPTAAATYTWSALVTPAAAWTADPTHTFELRAKIPTPNVLSAHARYVAKTHSASITGRLEAGGQPRLGVAVFVHEIGADGPDTPADITDENGAFSVTRPVSKTTSYRVYVDDRTSSCFDPSTAPDGCKSETLPAPPPAYVTAIVPRKTDPRVSIRSADQALAKRSLLTLSDFPGGQELPGDTGIPCAAFAPDLRTLTVSGHASSPFFVTANQREAAYVTASVFTSVKSAHTAFEKEAQLADMKCEAADYASGLDPDARVAKLMRVSLPGAGNELRAYRSLVTSSFDNVALDLVFVRVGRLVIELHLYALDASDSAFEIQLARTLAGRAR